MQKKIYGPKIWSETLYFYKLDEDDIEFKENFSNEELYPKNILKSGDTNFYLPTPIFNDCEPFFGCLDDTNVFNTNTEIFQWYKGHRI